MFSIPFNVEKDVLINKPVNEVFNFVADFNNWPHWSPWLCQEPGCPVDIEGTPGQVGHKQAWNGKDIGSGQMHIASIKDNQSIHLDLHFLKPWKSHSKVGFEFKQQDGSCRVIWTMQGNMPFFMFFMKKMMQVFVGRDYERGLSMLKEYLETGTVPTQVDVKGVVERSGFYYIGARRRCKMEDLGPAMEADLNSLNKLVSDGKLAQPDGVLSLYHKMDMANNACEYTSAYSYENPPPQISSFGLQVGKISEHNALRVDHIGSYRFLGNAWSAAMGCQRSRKHKIKKGTPMYEVYENDPHTVSEKDIKTNIFIPIR